MKNRIQYVYSVTNAFFQYLQDGKIDTLTHKLGGIETHASESLDIEDKEGMTLWFKFSSDDTAATDISDVIRDLSLPTKHPNRLLIISNLERVTKDINPENELRVFFS